MITGDELEQAYMENEFPGWTFWLGVSGLHYARRPNTSPANTMLAADWAELRDSVREWLGRRHHLDPGPAADSDWPAARDGFRED